MLSKQASCSHGNISHAHHNMTWTCDEKRSKECKMYFHRNSATQNTRPETAWCTRDCKITTCSCQNVHLDFVSHADCLSQTTLKQHGVLSGLCWACLYGDSVLCVVCYMIVLTLHLPRAKSVCVCVCVWNTHREREMEGLGLQFALLSAG